MAKIDSLNKLAEKVTGENPHKKRISDALDYIYENISGETNNDARISNIINKISDKYSGGGSDTRDWTLVGYESEPETIGYDYEYSQWCYENWGDEYQAFNNDTYLVYAPFVDTSSVTNFREYFGGCKALMYVPNLNTSNGTNFNQMFNQCTCLSTAPELDTFKGTDISLMFSNCTNLEHIPVYNWSASTGAGKLYNIFQNVRNLTDESLNNILKSCITCDYAGDKTLTELGINKNWYPASRIEALSDYQNFINAGWTTGY